MNGKQENVDKLVDEMCKSLKISKKGLAYIYKYYKGYRVKTKSGVIGFTKNGEELINGKVPVYTESENRLLCNPDTLEVIGFIG